MITWPWRGLGAALALALLVHALAWVSVQKPFSWRVPSAQGRLSVSTRVLEATSPSEPAKVAPLVPLSGQKHAPIQRPPVPALPLAQPSVALIPQKSSQGVNALSNQENKPIDQAPFAQTAIETIASVATTTTANNNHNDNLNTKPGLAEPVLSGVKLLYPSSAKLQFDGIVMRKGSSISGNGLLDWSTDGNQYELSLQANALVLLSRTEKSVGQLTAQGLSPQRYSSVSNARSEQATHFRPDIAKIQFSNNRPEAILLPGAQDRVSVLIHLAGIVGGDPERYLTAQKIRLQVAGIDNADIWEFNSEGLSALTVPAATIQALKFSLTPRGEFDQKLEVWLAPQLGFLPIRIRQTSSTSPEQDFTDLVLNRLPPPKLAQ